MHVQTSLVIQILSPTPLFDVGGRTSRVVSFLYNTDLNAAILSILIKQ